MLYYRARDLSVGFDLGFPSLLRAGPCKRWAQSRCLGRVFQQAHRHFEDDVLSYEKNSKVRSDKEVSES